MAVQQPSAGGGLPEVEEQRHPRALEPGVLVITILLSIIGAIIGLQILTTLGITPNSAIIGVLIAIVVSRIPLPGWGAFRSIHRQNLVQSNISSATFGAANSLLLPIGIPVLMGMPELLAPMLIGATMGMLIDLVMLYWMFDTRIFAGRNAWPPGIAAAEAIIAGDKGGRRGLMLVGGTVLGLIGAYFGVSMSAFGVAFIGNIFALSMFGVGLLIRGYAQPLMGIDINTLYVPHGMMIGAGLVALVQVIVIITRRREAAPAHSAAIGTSGEFTRSDRDLAMGLGKGFGLYLAAAIILALIAGLANQMSIGLLVLWIVFAAVGCIAAEFIVGLSAMHAGWFPAFATALIFLVLGMLMGFPPVALGILVGFVASGGPAFADAGYDLKAGHYLRQGMSRQFEMSGRFQQIIAGVVGLGVAWVMVVLFNGAYFSQDLFPPVDRVYAATIKAGVNPAIVQNLLIWAIPGAVIQALGGPDRQMGILLATGLLILNPLAGWAVLIGIAIRVAALRIYGRRSEIPLTIVGAGCIAGDALYGFFNSVFRAKWTFKF